MPEHPVDPFDRRPLHPLTPHKKIVEITDLLEPLAESPEQEFTVTVVPIVAETIPPAPTATDVLQFERLVLATYS